MPQDDRQRKNSLVVPILLITLGALFLFRSWHPGFEVGRLLRDWWPLILIAVGLGKIWDSSHNRGPSGQASGGVALGSTIGVVAAVVVIVVLLGQYQKSHRKFSSRSDESDRGEFASHTDEVLELQGAKSVRAELKMGAGELNIEGGSSHLLNSRFLFNRKWDSPRLNYHVNGDKGVLEIVQDQNSSINFDAGNNNWDLTFNNDVPIELHIEMGAGTGELKLRDMHVTELELHMGAGQLELDLTGPRKSDLEVTLKGGVGQATIRLPRDVAVRAHAAGGIGSIEAEGLKKDGNDYTNEMWGKTPHKITLDVQGGIGQIELVQD
jgi:uncharacterized protein DUF2154/cell wall-active antibiotic response 4TMS protein YvqF